MRHEWTETEAYPGESFLCVATDEADPVSANPRAMHLYTREMPAGCEILRLAAERDTLKAGFLDELTRAANRYMVESLAEIREALQRLALWEPRKDGRGGTRGSAVAAIEKAVALEDRVLALEEENRRLREGLGVVSSFGGGTTYPDGEPHRAKCSRCDAPLKLTPPEFAA